MWPRYPRGYQNVPEFWWPWTIYILYYLLFLTAFPSSSRKGKLTFISVFGKIRIPPQILSKKTPKVCNSHGVSPGSRSQDIVSGSREGIGFSALISQHLTLDLQKFGIQLFCFKFAHALIFSSSSLLLWWGKEHSCTQISPSNHSKENHFNSFLKLVGLFIQGPMPFSIILKNFMPYYYEFHCKYRFSIWDSLLR